MTAVHNQTPVASSSPLSTPPPSSDTLLRQNSQSNPVPQYRRARDLPYELAQHAQTYYEETLFTQAFNFLTAITSNCISASNPSFPVIVPPPSHLAVAATLAVHPILTTRTTSREKWDQANAAFRLLNLVLTTVGPVESKFIHAFKFKKYEHRSSWTHHPDQDDSNALNIRFAETDSVWSRAEDFWQTIGWAFNCACLSGMHSNRWMHWQLWLEFMISVLEQDWELHFAANSTEESLIWTYIELASGGYARHRRIMRSIFADGSTRSLNEFREVFHNEIKPPSSPDRGIKKREGNVNVDKDVFGDYLAPDDSDLSDSETTTSMFHPSKRVRTRTPSARRTGSRASSRSSRSDAEPDDSSSYSSTTTLGPPAALKLRMRLLHLLSHISGHPTLTSTSPTTFPDLDELYTLFVEFIKPLPLPLFQQILSPSTAGDVFSPDAHTTLCEVILQRSLESAAPAVRSEKFLTGRKLREMYLPYAASGSGCEGQAKVGVLLDALVRRCAGVNGILKKEDKEEVMAAVKVGVERREAICRERMGRRKKKSGSGTGEEELLEREAWRWLVESGQRMRGVVDLLE